jgi:outer membrane protein assembly factor BamB
VWGGASVDLEDRIVVAGTGNCPGSPGDWGPHSEAIVALDLRSGHERWTFQPHRPGNDDLDFAGTPNLFTVEGERGVVGLGNKDGHYYVVDSTSGIRVWEAAPTEATITRPGSNFSTGGIIGPSAVVDGVVVATSAGDRGPFLHGMDADTGKILWQQRAADASYSGVTAVADVAFTGGNDFTLRAVDVHTGKVRWQHAMSGVVAAAPAIVGDRVVAVSGLREPGSSDRSTSSGVYLFGFHDDPSTATTSTTSTTAVHAAPPRLAPSAQACVRAACTIGFQFKSPPAGVTPTITARIDTDPFRLVVDAKGLGPPKAWLRADGPNAAAGATVYGVMLSESDDDALSAGIACVLDQRGHCEIDDLPKRTPTYRRLSILALVDADTSPTLADGYDRLVVTHSFDPPLQEVP